MTRNTLVLPSPAKLNLFLHITGRRPDGYHELQTLFQFLDYGDTLELTATNDGRISLSPPVEGVSHEDNLIVRAARLLQQHCNLPGAGVRITLDKRLPMGGGLGGGSSNAATVLVGLNTLWHCNLTEDELADLGLHLGADVPVFVRGRAAFAEGIGEKLTPASPPEHWFVVLIPQCQISTAEIFSDQGLTRDTPRTTIAPAFEGEFSRFRNDCEDVVKRLYPEVKSSLEWLGRFGPARLTGTGACIFGHFPTEAKAQQVWALKPSGINGFVAKGVNISPLHQKLTELN